MQKSFDSSRDICIAGSAEKLANFWRFFPQKTRDRLIQMVDEDGVSLLGYAVNFHQVDVVKYMLKEKYYDEQNFNSVLLDCVCSDVVDVKMLDAFYKTSPEMFTPAKIRILFDASGHSTSLLRVFGSENCQAGSLDTVNDSPDTLGVERSYADDGCGAEGYVDEGYGVEGYADDGYGVEGHADASYGAEGYVDEGYGAEGYADEGYADEGYCIEGYADDGYGAEGYGAEGEANIHTEHIYSSRQQDYRGEDCAYGHYSSGKYAERPGMATAHAPSEGPRRSTSRPKYDPRHGTGEVHADFAADEYDQGGCVLHGDDHDYDEDCYAEDYDGEAPLYDVGYGREREAWEYSGQCRSEELRGNGREQYIYPEPSRDIPAHVRSDGQQPPYRSRGVGKYAVHSSASSGDIRRKGSPSDAESLHNPSQRQSHGKYAGDGSISVDSSAHDQHAVTAGSSGRVNRTQMQLESYSTDDGQSGKSRAVSNYAARTASKHDSYIPYDAVQRRADEKQKHPVTRDTGSKYDQYVYDPQAGASADCLTRDDTQYSTGTAQHSSGHAEPSRSADSEGHGNRHMQSGHTHRTGRRQANERQKHRTPSDTEAKFNPHVGVSPRQEAQYPDGTAASVHRSVSHAAGSDKLGPCSETHHSQSSDSLLVERHVGCRDTAKQNTTTTSVEFPSIEGPTVRGSGKYSTTSSQGAAARLHIGQHPAGGRPNASPEVTATSVLIVPEPEPNIPACSESSISSSINEKATSHPIPLTVKSMSEVESPAPPAEWKDKPASAHLTIPERKLTTVYFKMLKLGVPPQSILKKMHLDGLPIDLSRRVMLEMGAAHHIMDSPDKINSDALRDATLSSKKKLLRLHWKPLNAENLSTSSLWCNPLGEELNVAPDSEEMSEIERLFGVAPAKILPIVKAGHTSKAARSKADAHHLPVVLDMQRATNVSIGLAYYRDVGSLRCILNAICSLNSMKKRLTVDRLLNLSVMLPHLSEAKALQGVETANKAEMFCKLAMEYYPHLAGRLSCFLTMSQFAEIQMTVIPKMQIYIKALDDIMQSKRLALILNKMLYIGNALNAGTPIGAAAGFSLSSLSYAMTLRGGPDKNISVVDFAVRSLREKGHADILQVVDDIKLVEDLLHLSTTSIANDATEAENEHADLLEQLKVAEDYLLFYYQGALENWVKAESRQKHSVKEEDLVNTPYGPGTVKEVRPNGMLKVRPLKWHLVDEVAHTMIIHKDAVSIRAPFVAGDVVDTHHGAGIVVEVRATDSVAVIRPMTWSMSSMSTPLIYEPIVGLRPLHDPARQNAMPSSESDLPKLTLSFVSTLKAFVKTSNQKIAEMKRLKTLMIRKISEIGNYFGEGEDSFNLADMVDVLRQFRKSLAPLYEAEVRAAAAQKMREERARVRAEKAALEAARAQSLLLSDNPVDGNEAVESVATVPSAAAIPSHFVSVQHSDSSDSDAESDASQESRSSDIADFDSASYEKWLRHYYNELNSRSNTLVAPSTGVDIFSFIGDEEDTTDSEPRGLSFADMERLLQQKETYGMEGLTTQEAKVLATLPKSLLQPAQSELLTPPTVCSVMSSISSTPPPQQKFSGFSFEHNIEDLLFRRQHYGVESLTSIELEALECYDKPPAAPNAGTMEPKADLAVARAESAGVDESPFSKSVQELMSGLSFDNLFSRNRDDDESGRDCRVDHTPSVHGAADTGYSAVSEMSRPFQSSLCSAASSAPPSALSPESERIRNVLVGRGNAAAEWSPECTESPSAYSAVKALDDPDSPFHGFSFTENIMELIQRRDLHGEDSLTSVEKEALEYYADVIKECCSSATSGLADTDTAASEISMSTTDAAAIRIASQSMHQLLESLKKSQDTMSFADHTAALAKDNCSDTEQTATPPLEDYVIEAIRARVAAEKLMYETTAMLLEGDAESDAVKREADEIIRRVEAEREAEVNAIIHRTECEESMEVDSASSPPCYESDPEVPPNVEGVDDDNVDVLLPGTSDSDESKDPNDDGERALWYQHMKSDNKEAK